MAQGCLGNNGEEYGVDRVLGLQPSTLLTNANNYPMPCLGLGTCYTKDEKGKIAIHVALQAGYRHIDTAIRYGNHKEIGEVL